MGADIRPVFGIGIRFYYEAKTMELRTVKSCYHPDAKNHKYCPECGREYEVSEGMDWKRGYFDLINTAKANHWRFIRDEIELIIHGSTDDQEIAIIAELPNAEDRWVMPQQAFWTISVPDMSDAYRQRVERAIMSLLNQFKIAPWESVDGVQVIIGLAYSD